MTRLKIGERVKVVIGSGLYSEKIGTIIAWKGSRDKYSYKDESPRSNIWVKFENGEELIMPKNRLRSI